MFIFFITGSTKQVRLIDKEYKAAVSKVKEFIGAGKRITIGMDCWTKKGLTLLIKKRHLIVKMQSR